ncbi:MAG: acyl-CoA reductase [Clostridia bacterium]|nr:acyl-CoA reductase [Clostridia bacterium]
MILYRGKIYDTSANDTLLASLRDDVDDTLLCKTVDREKLIGAIDTIASGIAGGKYDALIAEFDIDGLDAHVARAAQLLKAENTATLLKAQLPALYGQPGVKRYLMPAGVLFHIAAGNADVLPAYSVLTGLICGNVNVLKLPSQDNGITIKILSELISVMPELSDFIYVFDTPSSDLPSMLKMAEAADKIVVWGGEEAVAAVRRFAPPNVGIVEWGHKISFCYVGEDYMNYPDKLEGLACHIISTSQLLCSSCQRIYVNSDDAYAADRFCRDFLPFLQMARDEMPLRDIGAAAESSLRRYAAQIEEAIGGAEKRERVYAGNGCSLTAKDDPTLEISGFFGCCDVSALPLSGLFRVLRQKRGYLQTASIIADGATAAAAERIMARAGVVRITPPEQMSYAFIAEPHDGEAELSRYCRIISRYGEDEK